MTTYIKNFYIDDENFIRKDINVRLINSSSELLNKIYPWTNYYGPRRCLDDQYPSYCNPTLPLALNFDITSSYSIKLTEVFNKYSDINSPISNVSLYPIAVRYIDTQKNFYIERPPFQKEISFRLTKSKTITTKIWIPWTLMCINSNFYNNARLFFRHDQLSNMNDSYITACLPNIYFHGRICFNTSLQIVDDNEAHDIRYLYATVFNEFMNGGWNADLGFVLTDFQNSLNMFDYSDFPAITKFIDTTAEDIVKANPNYQISRINNIINFDGMSYDQTRAADFLSFFLKLSTFSLQETLNFYEELERLKHMTNPNAGSMIPSQSFDQILQSCQEETPFSYSDMFYNCLKHYDNSKIDYPNNNKKLNLIIHNYPKDSLLYKEILSTNTYSTAYKVCQAVNPQDFITMMKQATSNVSEVTTIAYDYDNRIVQLIELDTDFVSYYQNFLSNNSNTPSLNAV